LAADSIILNGRGETAFLGPAYLDRYGNATTSAAITFDSRDPAVATVQPDGLITAGDAGATWVAMSLGGSADSLLVTVDLRGAITISFDDGWLDTYTNAFPILQEFNLRANSAVNPAQVGLPAYMSKSQLDELHAAGWSVVSHTMTHDSLTTTTAGELDWELRASQIWIDEQGYNGSNVFIVPYHDWAARERDAIGQYYVAARGTTTTITSPDSIVPWKPSNPYDLTGVEAALLPFTTLGGRDSLRALLQRTVDEGAFVDVFFHHLLLADVDAFRETVMVIDEFRDRVLPYHELYPRFARSVF
jgi:peptidoglycan/xylan/chitin deacetylase (PgdA/CDA1 family)